MPQAVIFIGVQATGKSTFYLERFFKTHLHISLDVLKTRHREKAFLDTCLKTGQSFVVDNTNPTAEDRQRYILPAKAAHFEVIGYYFAATLADSLRRNQGRPGKERIPDMGVRRAYFRLQAPDLKEGFDKLFVVNIDPQGSFSVEECHA